MKLQDNFDFTLGWGNTHEDWGGVMLEENVIQHKDCIEIKTIKEKVVGWRYKDDNIITLGKDYSTGHLVSKQQWLYGTFECDVVLPDFRGQWGAFWLYPQKDDGLHKTNYDEIDFFEQFRKNKCLSKHKIQANVHKNGKMTPDTYWQLSKIKNLHIKGEWSEDHVAVWANGRLFYELYGYKNVSHRPMNVLIGMGLGNWCIDLNPIEKDNSMFIKMLKVNGESLI